jgi:phenylpyruvate tautomerase PptA (4-oxalocrotonate tautomerase family)
MPHVQIWVYEGKAEEYRRAIVDGVQAALAGTLGIPGQHVFTTLQEMDAGHFRRPGWSSERFTLIRVAILSGKDAGAKKRLYRAIADNLARSPGIGGNDIVIMLRESPGEDWSVRDGLPASETGVPR